jgi:hypothetical protein
MSVAGVEPGHTHELPAALRSRYRMLMLAVVALLLAVGTLTYFVYQQQQYVQGRGEYRDAEAQRLEESFRRGICDLLDQLPSGALLDRPRAKYDCGPGIPLDQLPPEIRQRFEGTPAPSRPAESAMVPLAPPLGSAAVPGVERPTPNSPSSPPNPGTAPPSVPPLVGLGPITGQVCDLAGVCG